MTKITPYSKVLCSWWGFFTSSCYSCRFWRPLSSCCRSSAFSTLARHPHQREFRCPSHPGGKNAKFSYGNFSTLCKWRAYLSIIESFFVFNIFHGIEVSEQMVTVKVDWSGSLNQAESNWCVWELEERLGEAILADFKDSDGDLDSLVFRLCLDLQIIAV